ncbi:unnamed protein product [Cuscuta campestris]|uniref:Uncharacterized protein n=1 Tax=Cuscuta campestris TaxID=132261 RepID=A0A484K6G0_9ASTE|nr:unnamed protein product [Cuscuta campestris]
MIPTMVSTNFRLPISCLPAGCDARSSRIDRISSTMPPSSSSPRNRTSGSTIPASTAAALFSRWMQTLNRAAMASFFPRTPPSSRRSISGRIPSRNPISSLFSSSVDRLNSAAAEFSLAPAVPVFRISIIAGIGLSSDIALLFDSSIERLSSAVTACSRILKSGRVSN